MEGKRKQPVLSARLEPDGRVSTEFFPNPLVDGETQEALQVYASTFLRAVDKEHLPLEEAQAKARRAVRLWKDERLRQEQALLTRKTY